jgi:hypothetical protein
VYGVITNKQKPFVIYEWISQFREVAFPKLCMGRDIGKCEFPPTRHSISYNHLNGVFNNIHNFFYYPNIYQATIDITPLGIMDKCHIIWN